MHILGISAYYHDSAACILKDGEIVAAAQEERFTRKKHDASFPSNAIQFCLEYSSLRLIDVDYVIFYDKPIPKFERLLETYLAYAPKGFRSFATSMPIWVKDKLFQKKKITDELDTLFGTKHDWNDKLLFSEHHLSHAASAFFPSPFNSAVVLTLDGVGEWTTTSLAIGEGNNLEIHKEIHFPHSLGLLYSAFTYYTGFKVNSGEYKVMGLAPYGEPKYVDKIKSHLIDISDDGSFQLNMDYFSYCTDLKMTNDKFDELFGGPARAPESELTQREMDLAASIQVVTEEVLLKLVKGIKKDFPQQTNLCLAGGVALNCVANGILKREQIFENIWIQPAAGDAGGAVGAALSAYHIMLNGERHIDPNKMDAMYGSYLGPEFSADSIRNSLVALGASYEELDKDEVIKKAALSLSEGAAIGWMSGRMEFGPRALGGRSIIADPRSPKMQKLLNLKVKYRESFRPFAPSILFEHVGDWFEHEGASPYMLLVANINENKRKQMTDEEKSLFGVDKLNVQRSEVPAITHVDYSARLQTVHAETNPNYHKLISEFCKLTGCPILVNTSFNIRGEPIVCTPEDAFNCFMATELDYLVIDGFWLSKKAQDPALKQNYSDKYELD